MKTFAYWFMLIVLVSSVSHAQTIENIWTARAIEAKNIIKKYNKKKSSNGLSKLERCKMNLEIGFESYLNMKKLPKAMHYTTHKGLIQFFTLLLGNGRTPEAKLIYTYRSKSTFPVAFTFVSFTPKWAEGLLTNVPNSFDIKDPKCSYIFNKNDYLHPTVSVVR